MLLLHGISFENATSIRIMDILSSINLFGYQCINACHYYFIT